MLRYIKKSTYCIQFRADVEFLDLQVSSNFLKSSTTLLIQLKSFPKTQALLSRTELVREDVPLKVGEDVEVQSYNKGKMLVLDLQPFLGKKGLYGRLKHSKEAA